jgi:uncharacterized protein (DUF433 family)
MATKPQPWERRLYLPAYGVSDAARYAKTKPQTVSYWHHRGGSLGPALPGREKRQPLSYMELVEVGFVATFRRLGVSLQRIRKAHDYFAQRFQVQYPFAQLELKTEGQHVLMEMLEVDPDPELKNLVIVGDTHGQVAWKPAIARRFKEFEYDFDIALTWYVAGRTSPIVIDPRIQFGAPNVRGIPTWAVRGRRVAGETIADIAADFGLDQADVRRALSFELKAA